MTPSIDGRRRKADERQQRHGDERAGDEQHARAPPVGDVAERELRDRVRHLEAHLQRSGRGQRQVQLRDEQRQQRRVDVAEAVDEEMRAGHQQDCGMQSERALPQRRLCTTSSGSSSELSRDQCRRLRGTRGCGGYARRQRAPRARPRSTPPSRTICRDSALPGSQVAPADVHHATAAAMTIDAITMRTNELATRRPRGRRAAAAGEHQQRGIEKRRNRRSERQAAVAHEPHERDVQHRVDSTVATLTLTGVRFSPSA